MCRCQSTQRRALNSGVGDVKIRRKGAHSSSSIRIKAAFGLNTEGKTARMRRISERVKSVWSKLALSELGSAGPAYVAAIEEKTGRPGEIFLVWPSSSPPGDAAALRLAGLLEYGLGPGGQGTQGPFDMRKFLLKSPLAQTSKGGERYIRVPLGSGGARGAHSRDGAGAMRTARGEGLRRLLTQPGHVTAGGRRLTPVHAPHQAVHVAGGPSSHGDRGIRTASTAGAAWVHPGHKPRGVALKVSRRLKQILRGLI